MDLLRPGKRFVSIDFLQLAMEPSGLDIALDGSERDMTPDARGVARLGTGVPKGGR